MDNDRYMDMDTKRTWPFSDLNVIFRVSCKTFIPTNYIISASPFFSLTQRLGYQAQSDIVFNISDWVLTTYMVLKYIARLLESNNASQIFF